MNKYISFIICSLLFVFTSCEDYLDKPPLDQIGNESYWKTASDLKNYTVQFYTYLPSYGYPNYCGIYSDDANNGSDDAIMQVENIVLNGSRPIESDAKNTNWTWNKIRTVNIFFENYHRCTDDFSSWSQYLGEAHFFRAFLYFEKVKCFGDVPWYNKPLDMESEDLYKARDPRTLVVDSILSDLDKAIEYLKPIKSVDGGTNCMSKEAALLFKSRVALFEGSWQKYHAGTPFATQGADPKKYFRIAVEAAEELMSGKYSVGIYGNSAEDYGLMFGMNDMSKNPEVLLWKDYDKALGLSHESQVYLTSKTNGRSGTFELVEAFLSKEGEPIDYLAVAKENKGNAFLNYLAENSDPRLAQVIWLPGQVMWNSVNGYKEFTFPYIGQSGEYSNITGIQFRKGVDITSPGAGGVFGGDCETGAIVFRYAEALLNYAEAKYELDGQVDYDKSINLLRKRAGMPDFKVVHDANATHFSDYGYPVSDELFEIRRERRVELASEGFRTDDYRRWRAHKLFQNKRPSGYPMLRSEFPETAKVPAVDAATGLLDPFATALPNGYQFKEGRDYLECIPTNEITLNNNLTQNPGW